MLQSYPVILTPDENGTIIAKFPDVPEAITVGADEANALEWAQDALVVALTGYIEERRDIPIPSKRKRGQTFVHLPAQVAMKLAIYQGMRDQGITQATLGECIGVDGRQVRRILDLDHNTSLSQLVRALKCLGKELLIDIRNAA
jgi:antitoxin HicB